VVLQGLQPLEPIARGVLHIAVDVAEDVDELLLATVVILAPYAPQVLRFLRSGFFFGARTEQGFAMLEFIITQ